MASQSLNQCGLSKLELEDPNLWELRPGGFGYGDAGILWEGTVLEDMKGRYTTVYIRRAFELKEPMPTNFRLYLAVDYDNGLIAWLDGNEPLRINVPGHFGSQYRLTRQPQPPTRHHAVTNQTILRAGI